MGKHGYKNEQKLFSPFNIHCTAENVFFGDIWTFSKKWANLII